MNKVRKLFDQFMQVLFLLKTYLAKGHQWQKTKTPAQVLLELSGSWDDAKTPEQIVRMLENARKNSQKLPEGF